jgi:hypothetical protein
MGFWPFTGGKKSSRRDTEDLSKHSLLDKSDPSLIMARSGNPGPKASDRPTRSTSKRAGTRENKSRKLSKTRTDLYKNPSSHANIPRSQTAPLGFHDGYSEKHSFPQPQPPPSGNHLYQQNPTSQSSIGPEHFTALPHPPTLYAKRDTYDPAMPRKKSSKRKAEDHARERELRAMTSEPSVRNRLKRPVTYSGSGPLQRDTRNIPGPMNRRLNRPASDVSLPLPENISESEDAPSSSFRVGAIAALGPRPTLKSYQFDSSRSGKQPVRLPTVQQAPEEEEHLPLAKQRINELADDLGSGALRELMDRDRRRKEKKRETDKMKLQRKLQRRADKQKEEETRRARAEEFVSTSQAQLQAQQQAQSEVTPDDGTPGPAIDTTSRPEDPFADPGNRTEVPTSPAIRNPFEDEQDPDVMDLPSDPNDDGEPPIPVKSPERQVAAVEKRAETRPIQAALSPPTSPIQQPRAPETHTEISGAGRAPTSDIVQEPERDRRSSDQSGQQLSSWTSFFRRGGRRKPSVTDRGRATPSEFSNTSRESFARKQPPPVVPPGRTFRKSESATPQRTMSKFREDLPEFPISPPDSRVQSPEVAPASQAGESSLSSKHARPSLSGTLDVPSLATSSSNPTLDRGRAENRVVSSQAGDYDMTAAGVSGHGLSQSLASVDSEGSWLSGRPVKRLSGPMSPAVKEVSPGPAAQMPGAFEPEDEGLADDEYLKRLSPPPVMPGDRRESMVSSDRKASSTIIDLQQERASSPAPDVPPLPANNASKDEKWHEGVGRQPTVVKAPTRAKSREGLLKDSAADEGNGSDPEEEPQLMRARSVDYKGHARHMSAGSARLLDIRRSSIQSTDTPPRSPALAQAQKAETSTKP